MNHTRIAAEVLRFRLGTLDKGIGVPFDLDEAAEIVAKIRHLIRARATSSARPGRESFLDTDDSELRGGGATRRRGYGSVAAEKAHNK